MISVPQPVTQDSPPATCLGCMLPLFKLGIDCPNCKAAEAGLLDVRASGVTGCCLGSGETYNYYLNLNTGEVVAEPRSFRTISP